MNDVFPSPGLPPEGIIDVWRLELDRPLDSALNFEDVLSPEERERATRFVFPRDSARFRRCRAMLRLGLAWYLERHPGEIALTVGWRGKPCLTESSGLYFNVTHCRGMALIAFTTAGEVGIDIEAMDRNVEALDIASSYFTPTEIAIIEGAGTQKDQVEAFLRFWTRKEAVLKADGCGILEGLNTVDVSLRMTSRVQLRDVSDAARSSTWLVRDLEGIEGFAGAVAAPPEDWSVRPWPIPCEGTTLHSLLHFHRGF